MNFMKKSLFLPSLLASICWLGVSIPTAVAASSVGEAGRLRSAGAYSEVTLETLEAELRLDPDNLPRRYMKALTLTMLGRDTEALDLFLELARELPASPEPLYHVGLLYAKEGLLEEARTALKSALYLDPRYAPAQEILGDVETRLAAAAYAKTLELAPDNTTVPPKLRLFAPLMLPQVGVGGANPAALRTGAPSAASADAQAVEGAIKAWADAWSRRDVTDYLRHYAPAFEPAGMTRAAWEAQRRERIAGKTSILVRVSDLQVAVQGDQAHARLTQHYVSNRFRALDRKSLRLVKVDNAWLIRQETTE